MKDRQGRWDMFDDYVVDFACDRAARSIRTAIVTLVEIEGSSPLRVGAQMAVAETGEWVGYLSGGCIERAIAAEACAAIRSGAPRRVRYGRGSPYMDIRLPCGGAIELVIDVGISASELQRIDAAFHCRMPCAMEIPDAGGPLVEGGRTGPFRRLCLPRRQLVVAGIGPVTVQLARQARSGGFDVIVASSDEITREAAAVDEIESRAIGRAAGERLLGIDARSAVVLAFHDHEWETGLLPEILRSDAFYIGAMGSRRTHALRVMRLKADGFDDAAIARIRAPAGILPGVRGATGIAASIYAEILQGDALATGDLLMPLQPERRSPGKSMTGIMPSGAHPG